MKTDAYIKDVVVAAIRRKSIDIPSWISTRFWDEGESALKGKLALACNIDPGEQPILYSYIDSANWTLITTRRIWSSVDGHVSFVAASDVTEEEWGNFKGHGQQTVERMQLRSRNGEAHHCPYETGIASMGAIYAVQTLRQLARTE